MNQELIPNSLNPYKKSMKSFDEIRVSLASPEQMLAWSHGEIEKPETINYRTFKPENKGLFCARIFGPIKDYECLCGKYKRLKYRGVICEKCGVELTLQKTRRERMGHISLAAPVAHIWFLKSLPSRISTMLNMALRDLERVLYFENYIVIDSGLTDLTRGQLLSEKEHMDAQDQYGSGFTAGIGAEAIRDMLAQVDLEREAEELRAELTETTGDLRVSKIIKRLKLVESFVESGNRPEWMILTVIPVIPPELRPLVPLDGGRFATSDLNDLYRRVVNRNNRLRRLIDLRAPDIIVRNEKRMLQEAVDSLFDNGRRGRVITGTNKRPLKSLSDMLKGKQGRFRQNLLGKRVDFSGRSVIVTGPELKLHQCGLPKKMALELFKPFIFARLEAKGLSTTIKQARRLVERERPEVWDILDEVIREHPVLLNRAPTLHRLGIQAFEPVLIEGKAIQLHPLVCSAFNADFDGDQMAVHVPLSLEAQLEARVLMMSTNNVLSPANGAPIIVPSQDMVLGLYYITLERGGLPGEGMIFADLDEVEYALDTQKVHLHSKITVRLQQTNDAGEPYYQRFDTTPGRVRLGALLPQNAKTPFSLVNRLLRKKEVQQVIDTVYRHCGQKQSILFCDRIMLMGFREAFKSGISFGKDDMMIPQSKWKTVNQTRNRVKELEQQYMEGIISQQEKYNKVIDAWSKCSDDVANDMMDRISSVQNDPQGNEAEPNSVYMMAHSGARGSPAQMKQLAGMRGLMAKPSGEIIETPIVSNFKEGLTVLEYFNSTHGARKGLADTALKTANSGYLTRRLVDVAQDCIIRLDDCGTNNAITVQAAISDGEIVTTLAERILGRVAAEDVVKPATEQVLVKRNELIDEAKADLLEKNDVFSVNIRSPLVCEAKEGLCAACYGRDLARGTLVNIGEAVGIIAAQSIGEPGTQLTMRTFHVGGIAQGGQQSFLEANYEGKVKFINSSTLINQKEQHVCTGRNMVLTIVDKAGVERIRHKVGYGTVILVRKGQRVKPGDKLLEWDPYTLPVIAEAKGQAQFCDLISGVSVLYKKDDATGMTQRIVDDWRHFPKGSDLKPAIAIIDPETKEAIVDKQNRPFVYNMSVNAILSVDDGDSVDIGDVVAHIPREGLRTKDITGGLPRVAELFEARRPKDHAVIAEADGYVRFERDYKNKKLVLLEPEDKNLEPIPYMLPRGRHIPVNDGDFVRKGENIMDGTLAPHDILRIMGVEALANYLIDEVQSVYRLQGVKINDKHIEVIIHQMLQKWEILDGGDTLLIKGENIDKHELEKVNSKALSAGQRPAITEPILQGVTKASLQTRSFISAASFQETTRVLIEASTIGKRDKLIGLKENVIVGRLIPAGTGESARIMKSIALQRDRKIIAERAAEKEEIAALAAPDEQSGEANANQPEGVIDKTESTNDLSSTAT